MARFADEKELPTPKELRVSPEAIEEVKPFLAAVALCEPDASVYGPILRSRFGHWAEEAEGRAVLPVEDFAAAMQALGLPG